MPTSRRSPRSTHRSSGSSSSRTSAATASLSSLPTSTSCSARRPLRCAARGTSPTSWRSRPIGGRPREAVRIPPRLSGQCARPRLRLQPLGAALDGGQRARRVRARRRRGGVPRKARPSVLVLLPVQRLQQHARGRLGDDPARLRRARRPSRARGRSGRGRLQLARGSRTCGVGRREARARRVTTRRLPCRRLPRQQVLGRALAGQLGGGRGRLRRHARAAPRAVPARSSRSRATGRPQRPHFRGSPSRGAGASSRRRSSTARPART